MNVNRDATVGGSMSAGRSGYVVGFAHTPKEVEEAQRLRYQVFVEELGVNAAQNHPEMDVDEFDAYCRHLIVRDADSGLVVACYRLLFLGRRRPFRGGRGHAAVVGDRVGRGASGDA